MRCPECAAETTDEAPLCVVCGAPMARQPAVPADPAGGTPEDSLGTALTPAASAAPAAVRARGKRLRVTGVLVAMGAVAVIITACVLPALTEHGKSLSIWNDWDVAVLLEPLGVATIAFFTAFAVAKGTPRSRWVAAGMLLAFGTQTFLYFWGVYFPAYGPAIKAAGAGIVGMAGGLMLVAAGVLGAVGNAAGQAAPDLAAASASADWPNAG